MTFDLEKARDAAKFDDHMAITMFPLAIAEIERLRAIIDTPSEEPEWVVDFKKLNRSAGAGYSLIDIEIAKKWHTAYRKAQNSNLLRKQEIERLREALDESEQILAHKTKTATHWYEEGLKTRADLVQSKRVVEQQAARLKELESSLDEAESLTKKNADLMNAYLARIAELEDALVEGLTNFLHYRASCYDPARRCPYAKECDDCSTWDACGHVEKFRSEARQRLQAEGKIGPDADAAPRSWQITEERKAAIDRGMRFLAWSNAKTNDPGTEIDLAVLRAMLTEADHDNP